MPALNFKKEFAPLVESGKKKQTIRQVRKNPIKAGDTLYLYTGMRTKQCRKLREETCTRAQAFSIDVGGVAYLGGKQLDWDSATELAIKDGFDKYRAFRKFFNNQYGLPFEGVLIEWD
ncbi:ASCH domain-containing protein [Candidatus Pacearchaeota archaeon]|nr:ASCH domain-containing protein [Candidatus Pacearchaeota archaeon]